MPICPYCSSLDLTRDGHDQRGRAIRACRACGRHATCGSNEPGLRHRFPRDIILLAVRYYLQLGAAAERIAGELADRTTSSIGRRSTRAEARRRSRGVSSSRPCFPVAPACGKLLRGARATQTPLGERLAAAGEGDERPGIARAQRGTATAAGYEPGLETGAIDLQRTRCIACGRRGDLVARPNQRVHARPIAAQQPRRRRRPETL
jgi:hypothetical protein